MTDTRRLYRPALFGGLLLCIIIVLVWWLRCGATPTTLFAIRHADRTGVQDALSAAGLARAQELVHVAEKVGIAGIYHSEANRARQTAEPLATALGITPLELPANDIEGLVGHIFANHRGETVLVIGHSNTVPQIIAAAGGPTVPNLPEDEFDNFFVLEVCRCRWGPAKLVNLQYGVASP